MTRVAAGAVAAAAVVACAAAPRSPGALRGYEVVVPTRDTVSWALAAELDRAGVPVRRTPRGGARDPAILVWFEFREPGEGGRRWFNARLYHARSSVLLASATVAEDALPSAGRARARIVVEALLQPRDSALSIDDPM
jgi:hypothetical protein